MARLWGDDDGVVMGRIMRMNGVVSDDDSDDDDDATDHPFGL